MLIGEKGVKYGLQVRQPPKKTAPVPKKTSNVFGDDESDEEPNVEQQIARQAARKQEDKKVADLHAAALAEDASVFDYDAHYDSIQDARAKPKREEKMQRQSKYIAGLLEKAEERKREQDILFERKLAKDREAEDYLFGDKEKFITSAYRKKLEETAKWQEDERKRQEEEERNAVEKKGHMGDFYRNLLRNNVAFGTSTTAGPSGRTKDSVKETKPEPERELMPGRSEEKKQEQQRQEEEEAEARPSARLPPPLPGVAERAKDALLPSADRPAVPVTRQQTIGEESVEQQQEEYAAVEGAAPAAGQRRNREDTVAAARERYLARKRKAAETN